MYNEVEPAELAEELASDSAPNLIDVRELHELEISKFPIFQHIPLGEVPDSLDELDKSKDYVVTCRTGNRSGKACEYLSQAGYRVRNLKGGINRWAAEVDTSLTQY